MFLLDAVEANNWITLVISICTLIGLIGGLIPTIVCLVKKFKEIAKNKDWKQIEKMILAAMSAAEESGKSGADKKQMAIDAVKAGCVEIGIELDEDLINDIIAEIEKLCSWSKTVNCK